MSNDHPADRSRHRLASRRRRRGGIVTAVLAALAALVLPTGTAAAPVSADPAARPLATGPYGDNVIIDGHGNGHGIGLGQYGALGYAIDHGWNAGQILDHYYGGTVAGTQPSGAYSVRLTRLDDLQTSVVHFGAQATTASDPLARAWGSITVREIAEGTYRVWARADQVCPAPTDDLDNPAGGWSFVADVAGPVTVTTVTDVTGTTDVGQLLAVCEPDGTVRSYRGNIRAVNGSEGENRTVNEVPLEQYLRSVVASEVPAGWATLGGGLGAQALLAQAVAARSYAHNQSRYTYARTCDTQACQVYSGAARRPGVGGAVTPLEYEATDAAVTFTTDQVRRVGNTGGPIANTLFSSSTGGWTAPTTSPGFPAVVDEGDDVSLNPHHSWTTRVPVATVEAAWPSIGPLQQITVTKRNGLGDFGGRALEVVVRGETGQVTVSGDDFRRALGLRSNWFAVRSPCFGRDEPVVTGSAITSSPMGFAPVTPVRVVDSRNAIGTNTAPLLANCTLAFDPGPRPAGAVAAAITLTTTRSTGNGYTTAYPCATPRPYVSAVQVLAGLDIPGTTVVPLGPDGRICIYTSVTTDVVVDVSGWFTPGGDGFESTVPTRLLDSRRPLGAPPIPAGTTTRVPIDGGTGVGAVSVNITGTLAQSSGYVTAYPCDAPRPESSVLNVRPGVDIADHALVAVGGAAELCLWNSVPMHLIADVDGWFGTVRSQRFTIQPPNRAVDTRGDIGTVGPLAAGETRAVDLGDAGTYVFELTAVDPAAAGYVTAFPCGPPAPDASVLNTPKGVNVANLVVVPSDATGRVCFYASMPTHLLVDVVGHT